MKKQLPFLAMLSLLTIGGPLSAQRFNSEIFTGVNITHNVIFGFNYSGIPTDDDATGHSVPIPGVTVYDDTLRADVYEPIGDTMAMRPVVIVLHTGSFLPPFYNGQTTGQRIDSAVVEMCKQFARRGYTAIAPDYRLGWNPQALGAPGQEIRTGTLLQAAGRSVQDIKACVRFFRNNALNGGNTWHIDDQKIILGGLGTGGYIALAYATIDTYADVSIPGKFTATVDNSSYGFMADSSYFAMSLWGDIDGYGGLPFFNNSGNTPGIANDIHFAFNMGGALADSSWLRAGDVPMVCFHPSRDPFAPYDIGNVVVPVTGDFVIEAFGSYYVVHRADSLNNNALFQSLAWSDPYSLRANQVNDGNDGLFPFDLPPNIAVPIDQAGPWEWWDSTTVYAICTGLLGFTMGHTDSILANSWATNPDMSKMKALTYIDTVMNYLNPRISIALALPTGLSHVERSQNILTAYPNPASDRVRLRFPAGRLESVELFDIGGRRVYARDGIRATEVILPLEQLVPGMYLIKAQTDRGEATLKLAIH